MSHLWLPEQAEASLHEEYSSRAEARRVTDFTERLKAIDPRLRCYLHKEPDVEGLRQGFYYLIRRNDDGTTAVWEVQDEGRFREPDEQDIQAFYATDLWKQGAKERLKGRAEANRRERRRAAERTREQQREHLREKAAFAFRTQIPVSKDVT